MDQKWYPIIFCGGNYTSMFNCGLAIISWKLGHGRVITSHGLCRCKYRKTSSINRTKSQSLNVSCILAQLSSLNPWSQVLSWEWRCGWSSADRRCSNYIWVINNFIAYKGATYTRCFTVLIHDLTDCYSFADRCWKKGPHSIERTVNVISTG